MNCSTCGVQTARTLIDGLLLTVDVASYREHECVSLGLSIAWDAPADRAMFECLCGTCVVIDKEGVRRDWPGLTAHKPHGSAPKVKSAPQSHAGERKVTARARGIEL